MENIKIRLTKSRRGINQIVNLMKLYDLYEKTYEESGFKKLLSGRYKQWQDEIVAISSLWINGALKGVSIKSAHNFNFNYCGICCYVEPEFRCKGYATKLITKALSGQSLYAFTHQFPYNLEKAVHANNNI